MEDIFATISGITASDIMSLGSVSAALLAIITLSKQLVNFLVEIVKFICWAIWKLILYPAFYISLKVLQCISFLFNFLLDKIRMICK